MCEKCGCSDSAARRYDQASAGAHGHVHARVAAELSRLDRLAERNRGFFRAKRVFVVNLLSCAGAGVRPFIARTVADRGQRLRLKVVTAEFLAQIHAIHAHPDESPHATEPAGDDNLHLDAHLIAHALDALDLDQADLVLLENGGSAASQAVYDLGETARVALFSVRDGAFKPLKFPLLFAGAAAVVISELDQAATARFDLPLACTHIAQVAPEAQVLPIAAATGAGMEAWYAFLEAGVKQAQAQHQE